MRPHLLEINAFGPFAGTASVDLDDLGAAGLLLLHGETGAGKTSVLDALGYALYGEVPGDRGIRGLRSEHAGGLDETWVRLTFSVGGRRLRIRRAPEQSIPKQRGDGSTTRRASVLLEELDGEVPRALATRLDEAGMLVADAVGMTASQFFQVVLLPQGRFAAFLQAPAAQRQVLLQQLFGTERFADVEAALKRRRDLLRDELETLSHERDAAVNLLAHVSLTLPDVVPSGAEPAVDWAHSRQVSLAAGAEAAEAAAERAALGEAAARAAAEVGARLAERRQRRATLLARQQELASSVPEAEQLRERLANARLAAPLAPDVRRLLALRDQHPALETAVTDAASALAGALSGCPGLAGDAAQLERMARDRLAVLSPVLTVERDLVLREQALAAAAATVQDAELRHVAAEGALVELRQRCAKLTEALVADEATLAGLSSLAAAVDAARGRADAAGRLPAAETLAVEADTLLQNGRAAALDAKERWLDLRQRRLLGIAAELAAELADGEPCAVCGGLDHPRPASPQPDAVTEVAERAAHAAFESAELRLEPLREALRLASSVVTELRTRAGAPAAVADAEALETELARLERLAGGLPLRRAELEQARADLDRSATAVVASEAALTRARTTLAGLAGSMDEQRAQVEAAREGAMSVAAREQALRRLAETATAARATAEALTEADRRLADLGAELAVAAAGAGFAGLDGVVSAVLDVAETEAAEGILRDHDDAMAGLRSALEDPDLEVDLETALDLDALTQEAAAAREALTAAFAARADAVSRAQQAATLTARITWHEAALTPVRERFDEVAALAELASGGAGNRLRMSLTSFVLAARLEQVAARASVRLAHMTSGRFTLQHTDEVADARSRSGLGLAVHDVWTGTQRPTSSLSGGESFMTALSLALGLADVVAEETGGRRIDTLFVDEGFGTLDSGALDKVMEVLDTLRDGGRLVGVVSHVEELQRRVPARLEVVRTETGSWLRPHHLPLVD
ncbi:MAG: repair protein SbcC/Rad50 [Frankiales bacterium]|nr:repair protein SbcC/Rad50 [Frankiales bacterium]